MQTNEEKDKNWNKSKWKAIKKQNTYRPSTQCAKRHKQTKKQHNKSKGSEKCLQRNEIKQQNGRNPTLRVLFGTECIYTHWLWAFNWSLSEVSLGDDARCFNFCINTPPTPATVAPIVFISFVHMQNQHVWIMHTLKAIGVVSERRRRSMICVCVCMCIFVCQLCVLLLTIKDRTLPDPVDPV